MSNKKEMIHAGDDINLRNDLEKLLKVGDCSNKELLLLVGDLIDNKKIKSNNLSRNKTIEGKRCFRCWVLDVYFEFNLTNFSRRDKDSGGIMNYEGIWLYNLSKVGNMIYGRNLKLIKDVLGSMKMLLKLKGYDREEVEKLLDYKGKSKGIIVLYEKDLEVIVGKMVGSDGFEDNKFWTVKDIRGGIVLKIIKELDCSWDIKGILEENVANI